MTCTLHVAWDASLAGYDFGPGHPMAPLRLKLANLELTIDAQRAAHAAIHALAHEVAGGRWLLTGGGGYEHVQVVPRTWTHLLFEAAGLPIDPASPTPRSWREYVSLATSQSAPETMTEGGQGHFDPLTAFETGYNLADPADQAIMATRKAVFPLHGLMP
jgi:acetoin utilization protein AcuC